MTNANGPLTNFEFLENFTGGDKTRMRKYITMFLGSAPAEAENIRKAMSDENRDALRASAHSLRPQTTYMGMKSMETLLRQIEEKVQNSADAAELSELVSQFGTDFTAACNELKEKLNGL